MVSICIFEDFNEVDFLDWGCWDGKSLNWVVYVDDYDFVFWSCGLFDVSKCNEVKILGFIKMVVCR